MASEQEQGPRGAGRNAGALSDSFQNPDHSQKSQTTSV